ncbi:MAG: penicillin-insensitive murein endopeptidase [Ignavibacteriales bacterium]|nr:penicillin-insensitive murein endopeptidase [Ignavibacteriales bacterium]
MNVRTTVFYSLRPVIACLIGFSSASAQVIIRERIAIDPRPPAPVQSSNGAGSALRYELQYDGPVRSPELNFMRMREIICGVDESAPLNSSMTVPAQSGLWNFSFRIHTPVVSNHYARFSVWLGDAEILSDSLLINCGSTCQINHQFGFRISNTFNFSANGRIFYTEQSFLSAIASGQQHCTTEMWHPGLPVSLRIISGEELGQFADLNGIPLGDAVTVAGRDVDNITFLADGIEPDSISDFVIIEAESFGITRTATIEVLRISESPIWLAMDAQGDVSYGAEMSIMAQALNMFQQEVSAGSGVTYSFEIIEGSEWGTLFRGTAEGNTITGIRPTDDFFSRGMATIGFRARKAEPSEPQKVTIRVMATNPEIRAGTCSFNVIPSPLAISVIPPTISYGERSTIVVQKKNPDSTVSPWPSDAGLSFEIIKGNNAGYILYPDTSLRNDSFNGQSGRIQFVALEESPQPDTVEVQFYVYVYEEGTPAATASSSAGVLAFDPIPPNPTLRRTGLATATVVKGDSLDHFQLELEKDTIAFTETAKIFVQAKDKDSSDIGLNGNTLLRFALDSTRYGSFIKANGDTVPSPLANVLYSDAKDGHVRFAAVNKNPDSVVSFRIIAKLQQDTTKVGDTTLVLLEQTLKIVMNSPHEVLPTKLFGIRNQQVTAHNRKSFVVQLTRNREPVPSHAFVLTTNYVAQTGGHDHVTPRRMANNQTQRRENFGYFILQRTGAAIDRPYQGTTQTDGRENLEYVASMFGDSMRIVVESADPLKRQFLRDSITIVEKVNNLQLLDDGTDYALIGGTCNHHGPAGVGICATPNNNHWASASVVTNIQRIASRYRQQFPTEQPLYINDMSLPFGGRFDIFGQWEGYSDHQYHRQGTDVDIRSTTISDDDRYIDVNRNGRYDSGEPITFDLNNNGQYDYTNAAFEEICRANDVLRPDLEFPGVLGQEHYHLYFHLYD